MTPQKETGSKWALYDALIEGIPADLKAEEILVCKSRTMIRSQAGCGMAMTLGGEGRPTILDGNPHGRSLRDVAALVRSWNDTDASIGTAAMNAWYNSEEHIKEAKARISRMIGEGGMAFGLAEIHAGKEATGEEQNNYTQSEDAFLCYQDLVRGKRVATVGHFAYVENRYAGICELSILERNPHKGDYPDAACEYILDEQDFVFITGAALINKTLPRLLQLCGNACVILCGPSTVMAPALFDFGVHDLAGFMVLDETACREFISFDHEAVFESGRMVRLTRKVKEI